VIYHGRGGDPEAIRVISLAFTHACSTLGLVHKSDGATQLVAKKIIEAAERASVTPLGWSALCLRISHTDHATSLRS